MRQHEKGALYFGLGEGLCVNHSMVTRYTAGTLIVASLAYVFHYHSMKFRNIEELFQYPNYQIARYSLLNPYHTRRFPKKNGG